MSLSIVAKQALTADQRDYLADRIAAPEHQNDRGPCQVWKSYQRGLYAIVDNDLNKPVGILYAAGPKDEVDAGWWIDSKFRRHGYGQHAIRLFAGLLRKQGFTKVGKIRIDTFLGEYDEASRKLRTKFIRYIETD